MIVGGEEIDADLLPCEISPQTEGRPHVATDACADPKLLAELTGVAGEGEEALYMEYYAPVRA